MFGDRIKKLRDEKNISQFELSEFLGISQQALSKWENEKTEPDNDSLVKLANYFNVSTDYLLGNSETRRVDKPYDDELEKVLFSKAKDLTEDEKKTIINVINAIKKDIDKDLDK